MKGNGPLFRGVLTSNEKDSKQRKNIGKVALWANSSQNAKAPIYTEMCRLTRERIALCCGSLKIRRRASSPSRK